MIKNGNCNDVILIVAGKLTESLLTSKDYRFYYPDEHKPLISLSEQKKPKEIIAVTGPNTLNGQNPFPLFEDGDFSILSGNISEQTLSEIGSIGLSDEVAHLTADALKEYTFF